jgi:hypothetical protein
MPIFPVWHQTKQPTTDVNLNAGCLPVSNEYSAELGFFVWFDLHVTCEVA